MEDVFVECLVEGERRTVFKVLRFLCMGLTVLCAVMIFFAPPVLFLAALFGLMAWFLRRYESVEYEYSLVNDSLDIDAIYSKESRKHKATVDFRNVISIERVDVIGQSRKNLPYEYYCRDRSGERVYGIRLKDSGDGSEKLICIEPSEDFRETMAQRFPRLIRN